MKHLFLLGWSCILLNAYVGVGAVKVKSVSTFTTMYGFECDVFHSG